MSTLALVQKPRLDCSTGEDFPPENTYCADGLGEAFAHTGSIGALVVDDSPITLETPGLVLEPIKGLQLVGTAADGQDAVCRAVELELDLVLMDLQLPGMDGLETARKIKSSPQSQAVILVTADDTPERRAAASAAGTDDFVGKQHLFTELPGAIRKLFPRPTF
jgi:CheY-like chemotaxis protein